MVRTHLRILLIVGSLLSAGCASDSARRDLLRSQLPYLAPIERPVIVVPGFGVSRLKDAASGEFVWGTPRNTVVTGYQDDLDLPVSADGRIGMDGLEPDGFVGSRGPINTAWQLSEGLRKFGGYVPAYRDDEAAANLFPFAWDWRRDLSEVAVALGQFVEQVLDAAGHEDRRVDIVAHSAGGNLVLTWLRTDADARSRVGHVILIGVPEEGTVDVVRVFARPERFLRRRFDTDLLMTWASLPQLLPDEPVTVIDESGRRRTIDFRRIAGWEESGLTRTASEERTASWAHALSGAEKWRKIFRRELPADLKVTRIAGDCVPTPARPLMRSDGSWAFYPRNLKPEEKHLGVMMFEPGDGTVTARSASAGDPSTLRLCEGHQGLASSPQVHRALVRTLRGWGR